MVPEEMSLHCSRRQGWHLPLYRETLSLRAGRKWGTLRITFGRSGGRMAVGQVLQRQRPHSRVQRDVVFTGVRGLPESKHQLPTDSHLVSHVCLAHHCGATQATDHLQSSPDPPPGHLPPMAELREKITSRDRSRHYTPLLLGLITSPPTLPGLLGVEPLHKGHYPPQTSSPTLQNTLHPSPLLYPLQ